MKGFFFAVRLRIQFSLAQTADKELMGIAVKPVALTKALHVPYYLQLFIILSQESPNTLSSFFNLEHIEFRV